MSDYVRRSKLSDIKRQLKQQRKKNHRNFKRISLRRTLYLIKS